MFPVVQCLLDAAFKPDEGIWPRNKCHLCNVQLQPGYFRWIVAHKNNGERNSNVGCRQTKHQQQYSYSSSSSWAASDAWFPVIYPENSVNQFLFCIEKIRKKAVNEIWSLLPPTPPMPSEFRSYVTPQTTNLRGILVSVSLYCYVLQFCLWCLLRSV